MLKTLRIIWTVICVFVLFVTLFFAWGKPPTHETGIFVFWAMIILSFPMGWIVPWVFGGVAFGLYKLGFTINSSDKSDLMFSFYYAQILFFWVSFYFVGYCQWFILLPKLINSIKRRDNGNTGNQEKKRAKEDGPAHREETG